MIYPAVECINKDDKVAGLNVSARYPDFIDDLNKIHKKGYVKLEVTPPDSPGTLKQNNTFHGLLDCYWRSGCHSFSDYDELKTEMKTMRGQQGVSKYVCLDYVLGEYQKRIVKTLIEAKMHEAYIYQPKSWNKLIKKERANAIDYLIDEMHQVGVSGSHMGKKFDEILRGME